MKRSLLLLGMVSYSSAAYAAKLGKPLSPGQVSQALKAGKTLRVAFANRNSEGCIGVDDASTKPRAPLMRFRCDLPTSNNPHNQYWILSPTRAPGEPNVYFTITNWKSEKCMGVYGGSPLPGAELRQFKCDNRANQKWRFTTVKRGNRTALSLQNYDRLCVGVAQGQRDAARLVQEPCTARPDQDWRAIQFMVH